ncbi:hypothetical protein ABPG72_021110 [Tetrahymena utriculariae]
MDSQPKLKVCDQMLKDLPFHKKYFEEFITQDEQKVYSQLLMLPMASRSLNNYFKKFWKYDGVPQNKFNIIQRLYQNYNYKIVLHDTSQQILECGNANDCLLKNDQQNFNRHSVKLKISSRLKKNKIRDLINKQLSELKQNYQTDNLINTKRACHMLLFYNKIKELIIQMYHQIVRNIMHRSVSLIHQVFQKKISFS